jgi:hypothetical protein
VEHTGKEWQNDFTKERSEEGTKEGPSSPKNAKVVKGRIEKPAKASPPRITHAKTRRRRRQRPQVQPTPKKSQSAAAQPMEARSVNDAGY